ncbi:MAG: hypothetical protein HFJ26_02280 [Clostridia bacterium]|nr:hypothetical protein [Clostridia bacterium]
MRENVVFLEDTEKFQELQELLEATKEDLRKRISALKDSRNERRDKYGFFSEFSEYSKGLKSAQADLEKLLRLVRRLDIEEVNEEYYIIYREKEIKSAEDYKRCTRAYETMINSIGFNRKVVFSECTFVRALIKALPSILVDEE